MEPAMEDMKFIGPLTILSQSFKTIFKWKNIFAQITLAFILPLAIVFILHMEISHRLFHRFESNPFQLFTGAFRSYRSYYDVAGATSTDWLNYFLFKSAFIAAVTAFSLLSTATVVYTTACVYTGRDVTFRKSIKVVPKVSKRLTVTLLSMLLSLFTFSLLTSVLIFISTAVVTQRFVLIQFLTLLAIFLIYIFKFMHITMTWQIASVVSVLESSYGLKSMIKATDLMHGKRKTAFNVSILVYLVLAVTVYVYMSLIVYNGAELAVVWRLMIGIVCVILVVMTFLLITVTETVLYLVCKSYHGEAVDPVSLSTFLSDYLSDSRPVIITGREVIQLGRAQNQPV